MKVVVKLVNNVSDATDKCKQSFTPMGTQTTMFLMISLQLWHHQHSKLDIMHINMYIYSIHDDIGLIAHYIPQPIISMASFEATKISATGHGIPIDF